MLRGSWNEKIICRRAGGDQKGWPDMFTLLITFLLTPVQKGFVCYYCHDYVPAFHVVFPTTAHPMQLIL